MRRLLALALMLCLLTAPAWAAPGNLEKTVEAEGRGLSEQAALQDAFRNAIEQVVGVMVSSQTEVVNFQTLRDRVFAHAEGYVTSYEILDRFHHPDGALGMRVRVVVGERNVHDDLVALKVLQMQVGNPKLVVSYDPAGPQHALTGLAVDRLNAYLASRGIAYVQATEPSAPQAALDALADAYVVVSAELRETRRSGDWRFVKARVQVRTHDAATGRGLGSETGYSRELAMRSGVMSGHEAAVEEAVRDAAERTMKLVVAHWKGDAYQGRPYRVTLRGIAGYEQQKRVTELLKEAGREVKLERSTNGEARFTVWSREPLEDLLDRVMTGAKATRLKLNLERQEPGRLELRLLPER
ncbi:hypothetical protein D3C72_1375860 [compost metagenome]